MSEIEKEIVDSAEVKESKNFIEQIIEKDLAEGVYDTVHTRFPLNPTDIFISDMPRVFC